MLPQVKKYKQCYVWLASVSTPTDLWGNIRVGFLWQVQKVTSVGCLTSWFWSLLFMLLCSNCDWQPTFLACIVIFMLSDWLNLCRWLWLQQLHCKRHSIIHKPQNKSKPTIVMRTPRNTQGGGLKWGSHRILISYVSIMSIIEVGPKSNSSVPSLLSFKIIVTTMNL